MTSYLGILLLLTLMLTVLFGLLTTHNTGLMQGCNPMFVCLFSAKEFQQTLQHHLWSQSWREVEEGVSNVLLNSYVFIFLGNWLCFFATLFMDPFIFKFSLSYRKVSYNSVLHFYVILLTDTENLSRRFQYWPVNIIKRNTL